MTVWYNIKNVSIIYYIFKEMILMALLCCHECKNKVSDKAETCPHCGCPIVIDKNKERKYSKVNGITYDVTELVDLILNRKTIDDDNEVSDIIRKTMDISPVKFTLPTVELGRAPEEINCETLSDFSKRQRAIQASKIHCPNCRSTDVKRISATERAASVIGFGLLSKKINKTYKCNKCKYTW
jgi:hypothetical protein